MTILLELLNLAVYLPFLKISEEDIGRNMNQLKKYQWFQNYRNDKEFGELIIYDKDVRHIIGSFKTKKMKSTPYLAKCQQRLLRILEEKSNRIA